MQKTEKENLRTEMISLLKQSPRPDLPVFDFPQETLIAYIPLKTEVNTIPLIDYALEKGKTVVVPTEDPNFFAVLPYNWKEHLVTFKDKSKGVYTDELVSIDTIENAIMLVPGLAFTKEGDRLGRGSGFYDRVLRRISTSVKTIGICRKCQVVSSIPTEPHDKRVDKIIYS